MKRRIIALLTDFGDTHYVGIMRGVILSINPNVVIVDITHNIRRHNIVEGAFILLNTYKYFPAKTIFVIVIDPGVGSSRKAIIVKCKRYIFIGPDNGVLYPSIIEDGVEDIYMITNRKYMLENISQTFHGRDIFAPIAGYVSRGIKLSEIGPKLNLSEIAKITFNKPIIRDKKIIGEILYIDGFGNIVTNIDANIIKKLCIGRHRISLEIAEHKYMLPLVKSYSDVDRGKPLLIIDSFNMLEIAINGGDASKYFSTKNGDKIIIEI